MVLKLHFDGEKIAVPQELRGRGPLDLEATILDSSIERPKETMKEFVDRIAGSVPRTQEEVLEILREIREGRDDER